MNKRTGLLAAGFVTSALILFFHFSSNNNEATPSRSVASESFDFGFLEGQYWSTEATQPPVPASSSMMGGSDVNQPVNIDMYSIVARQDKRKHELIYQLPMTGRKQDQTFCGIRHMRGPHAPLDHSARKPDRTRRTQPYLTPTAQCIMAGIASEWREKYCPDNAPHCQILMGDAGYKHRPEVWPHASHKGGDCVDIYLMRKKGFEYNDSNLTNMGDTAVYKYKWVGKGKKRRKVKTGPNPYYDSQANLNFAKLMVKWGIETKRHKRSPQFFIGDPKLIRNKSLGVSSNSKINRAHEDHFHVCIRRTNANHRRCKKLEVKPKYCPNLAKLHSIYGREPSKNGYNKAPVLAQASKKKKVRRKRKARRCGPKCRARKRRLARNRSRRRR